MKNVIFIFLCLLGFKLVSAQDTLYICNPGEAIELQTEQGDFLYLWTPSKSLTNPTIYNPTARPLEETTYIVRRITFEPTQNLIENPDFSEGNVGFSSDYPFVDAINTQGVFGISTSAKSLNGVFFEDCPDHTTGDGPMMVIDGSPVANERVWCQTIDIKPNSTYAFSSWLTSVKRENPAMLKFSINGTPIGQVFTAAQNVCEWRQFYELWNSESAETADICIINQNTNPNGNDFALDDFAFFELEQIEFDTIVVIVEALIAAEERRFYIPNIFSPNEDGFNDVFEVFTGKGVESVNYLKVFDQWGNLVSNGQSWDGRLNDQPANVGLYVYVAEISFSNGDVDIFQGSLQLVR
ncbi:T9SS type B sorting domain-containing protein [Portibacter marinus]|uniref:T9SS type B sorting domain-containing protein n=1 Tax=Portibacter marinus TaxID=2898660 RepID=UPI001F21CF96|nr:gliding motility-associated C-terminal domain-containing protein [Portibacter marinus]